MESPFFEQSIKFSDNKHIQWTAKSVAPFAKNAKVAPLSPATDEGVMRKNKSQSEGE